MRERPSTRSDSRHREADDSTLPEGAVKTGTTTLAAAGTDGVVLAADTRASVGGRFVTNRTVRKVEPIADRIAVAFAGSVSDAQSFVRRMRAEHRLYELEHGRPMAVETAATVAGGYLRRGPVRVLDLLLAGVDDGPAVYDVGPGGGVMRTEYAASGSGMQLAYGALEGTYDPGLPVSELRGIAASAVGAATERDTASGDGLTLATITAEGTDVEVFDDLSSVVPNALEGDESSHSEEVA